MRWNVRPTLSALWSTALILYVLPLLHGLQAHCADERVIAVGVYENEPKVFTDRSGQPAGIFIDIIKDIAQKEGWRLRFVPGTWEQGLERLERQEIDLMPDVAIMPERAEKFALHKTPVLSSWSQVYARKGSGIKSILDLEGKRVTVLASSIQQNFFQHMAEGFGLNITLIPLSEYAGILQMVAEGKADAAITNNFYGSMHAGHYGLEDTSVVFYPSMLVFAGAKNISPAIMDGIDRQLNRMKSTPDSVYYTTLHRWSTREEPYEFPLWLKFAGALLAVALLMSVIGSIILRRQVNARTAELLELNRQMEARIVERTAQLAQAVEKAQAADRIKSAFLATMSHELRTPLNSIIGFTGTMLQGLAGELNPEQHKQMSMVQSSSRHLLALINDVLDISKIEAGQFNFACTSFDLRASIEKVVKLIQPLAESKGLRLRIEISDQVGMVYTDQRRLEQVILNLLSNAVKFTDQGEVLLRCGYEGANCVLSVRDTGIGMPPEALTRLFQPFFQADSGLARKREGTGLGLSICKKILELLGGSIDVATKAGEGSTFTATFPLESKA